MYGPSHPWTPPGFSTSAASPSAEVGYLPTATLNISISVERHEMSDFALSRLACVRLSASSRPLGCVAGCAAGAA